MATSEYNPLLDPRHGPIGITRLIGGLTGAPTLEQHQFQQEKAMLKETGQARQRGMNALFGQIQQANGNVQRGVVNFLQTPEGQEVFMTDPDFFEEAAKALRFAQPTEATRSRRDFAEQAGVPVQDVAQLELQQKLADAQLKMHKAQQGGGTQAERAVAQLVDEGVLDEQTGLMQLGGLLTVRQRRNFAGDFTEDYDVIRKDTGEVVRAIEQPTGPTAQALQQSAEPGMVAELPPPQQTGTDLNAFLEQQGVEPVSGDIILGAGAFPSAAEFVLGFVGQVDPTQSGEVVRRRRDALRTIKSRVGAWARESSERLPADVVRDAQAAANNLNLSTNPVQAGQSMLELHDMLDRAHATAEASVQTARTQDARGKAEEDIRQINNLRATLPLREDVQGIMGQLRSGEISPIEDAVKEGGAVLDTVEGALGGNLPRGGTPPANVQQPSIGSQPPGQAAPQAPQGAQAPQSEPFFNNDPSAITQPGQMSANPLEWAMNKLRNAPALPGATLQALNEVEKVVPEAIREPIMNFATGFNAELASNLSVPAEALNEAMVTMGNEGFLDAPGEAGVILKNTLNDMGIAADDEVDSFMARVGRGTFNAGMWTGVMLAAAPTVAAGTGAQSVSNYLAREFQRFAVNNPGITAATEVGAVAGATAGHDLLDAQASDMSPGMRNVVNPAGEVLFGWLGAGAAAGPFRSTTKQLKKIVSDTPFLRDVKRTGAGEIDATPLRQFAEQAIEADRVRVNNTITREVNEFARAALPGGSRDAQVNPQRAAARLTARLRNAYKGSRTIERKKWAAVDRKRPMKSRTSEMSRFLNQRVNAVSEESRNDLLPMGIINRVRNWKNKDDVTINDFLNMRTVIRNRIEQGKLNDSQTGFLKRMHRKLLDEVERAYPDDVALSEARAYSAWQAERFLNGAIEPIVTSKKVFDADSITRMLFRGTTQGGGPASQMVEDVASGVNAPQVRQQAQSFIRNHFGEIARTANEAGMAAATPGATAGEVAGVGRRQAAQAGRKFLSRADVKNFMKAWPDFRVQAEEVNAGLSEALRAQEALSRSAFARFSSVEPADAFNRLMRSPEKGVLAEELMERIRTQGDTAAERAAQNGLMDWVFKGRDPGDISVQFLRNRLSDPGVREVFRTVYGQSGMDRLNRMLNAATKIERGEGRVIDRLLKRTSQIAGRVTGAAAGRALGTGTIQAPGIMANAVGRLVDGVFARFQPHRLIELGMQDPRWERILLSKDPDTLKQAKKLFSDFRSLIATTNSAAGVPIGPEAQEASNE